MTIRIHAFIALFAAAVVFILLTGWTGSEVAAWISIFIGIFCYGILILVAKIANRDFLKIQKVLNKKGYYLLGYDIKVMVTATGASVIYERQIWNFALGKVHQIAGTEVVELVPNIKNSKFIIVYYGDTPLIFTAHTSASLT